MIFKKKTAAWIMYIIIVFVLLNVVIFMLGYDIYGIIPEDDYCGNVAGIKIRGELVTYTSPDYVNEEGFVISDVTASEDIDSLVYEAENDDNIKAILVEIDSFGGSAVAAEEIANALIKAEKPTIALIRDYSLSAAYLAATGADYIIASENSEVGSIGVTMSYLDYSKMNEQEGITYQEINSAKFKNSGDPDKPLSEEEKELLLRDTLIMHDNFVKMVAENRDLEISAVEKLADGSSMLGRMALENGLIDGIGDYYDALSFLDEEYKLDSEVCWY